MVESFDGRLVGGFVGLREGVGIDIGGDVKLVSGAHPSSGQDSYGHSKVSSNGVNRTHSTSISD